MRWRTFSLNLFVFLAVATATAENRFLMRASPAVASAVAARHGLTIVGVLNDGRQDGFLVLAPDSISPEQMEAQMEADPEVRSCEPDAKMAVPESPAQVNQSTAGVLDSLPPPTAVNYFGTPVLAAYVSQPAASIVRLAAVQSTFTGAGIVAVIDTGVDPNHSALKPWLLPGYDFVHEVTGTASEFSDVSATAAAMLNQSTAGILDKSKVVLVNQSTIAILDQSTAGILDSSLLPAAFGHGTMVAGIIHLAAPTAQIMPLKAFKGDGTGELWDVLRAIYFAADHGAKVISMSFSLTSSSVELMRAIDYATAKGVIAVASTGNAGSETLVYPGALRTVIGVASTSNLDARSRFSNFGAGLVYVAAPGEGVITTYPGENYAAGWGTSFSTPLVAGAAALLVQADPDVTPEKAAEAIGRAKELTLDLGKGRLDIYKMLKHWIH